jgi:hypothetical protein
MRMGKPSFRFSLYVSCCLGVTLPALAQNTFDPFAPNTVAPSVPMAAPSAPTPVAPQLPPRFVETPPAQTVQAPATVPTPTPAETIIATPTPPEPISPSPAVTNTPAPESGPSFWDKFSSLFDSKEEPKSVVVKQEIPQLPQESAPSSQPISEPVPPQETPVTNLVVSEPAPEPASSNYISPMPEPYVAPSGPQSKDPFAASNIAPNLPTEVPKAVIQQNVVQKPLEPEPMAKPALSPKPVQVEAPLQSVQETPAPVEQVEAIDTQAEPSFFEKLGTIFSSNKPEETIKEEPAALVNEKIIDEPVVVVEKPKIIETPEIKALQEPSVSAPLTQETTQPSYDARGTADPKHPFAPQALSPTTPQPIEVVEPVKAPVLPQETVKVETPLAPEPVVAPYQPTPIESTMTEPESPGLFERIGNFFTSPFKTTEEPVVEAIQPITDEKPALEIVPVETELPEQAVAPAPMDARLIRAKFGLGNAIKLGQGDDDLSKAAKCFTKSRGTVAFCLSPTEWPSKIRSHFDVSSHLYKGSQGIIQLDGNIATQLFSLFNAKGLDDLVNYYENLMGPAMHHFIRKTRTLHKGMVDNHVYIWRKENQRDGLIEIFEIRQFAQIKGSLPNLEQGSVRAYFEGSREIFERASNLDFMDLR